MCNECLFFGGTFMLSKKFNSIVVYFTKGEIVLWFSSVIIIFLFFLLFDRENFLTKY